MRLFSSAVHPRGIIWIFRYASLFSVYHQFGQPVVEFQALVEGGKKYTCDLLLKIEKKS